MTIVEDIGVVVAEKRGMYRGMEPVLDALRTAVEALGQIDKFPEDYTVLSQAIVARNALATICETLGLGEPARAQKGFDYTMEHNEGLMKRLAAGVGDTTNTGDDDGK